MGECTPAKPGNVSDRRAALLEVTGIPEICPDSGEWWQQMAAIQLPDLDPQVLQNRLYEEYRVEVPVSRWEGVPFLRVSVQGYNTTADLEALITGLDKLLPELRAD